MAEDRKGPNDGVEPRFSIEELTTTRSRVLSGPPVRPSSMPPPPELEAMDLGWDGADFEGEAPTALLPPDREQPSATLAQPRSARSEPSNQLTNDVVPPSLASSRPPEDAVTQGVTEESQTGAGVDGPLGSEPEGTGTAATTELSTRIAELEAELAGKQNRERELEAALGAAQGQCRELATVLAGKQGRIRELEAALGEAHEQRRELKAKLAGKQSRERELEAALGAAEDQRRELEARVDALQNSAGRTGDDLTAIRGIGPAFERALRALGIDSYAQIAAWSDEQMADIAARLRTQPARILREGWVESAKRLSISPATGD